MKNVNLLSALVKFLMPRFRTKQDKMTSPAGSRVCPGSCSDRPAGVCGSAPPAPPGSDKWSPSGPLVFWANQ